MSPKVALFAALLLPGPLWAQVNSDGLRREPFQPGFSGTLGAAFALSRGNVQLFDVGGSGRVQFQSLYPELEPRLAPFVRQRSFLEANARFAENEEGVFISQVFTHLRWTAMWHRRLGSDLFLQYQYNEFLRLQARTVIGGGARVELVHTPRFLWWAGSGYMFQWEEITEDEASPEPRDRYEHRMNNYMAERFAFDGDRVLMQHTTYFQPRLDDFRDLRLLSDLELQVKITGSFGFGVTLSVLYDSRPPSTVRRNDLRLVNGINWSF